MKSSRITHSSVANAAAPSSAHIKAGTPSWPITQVLIHDSSGVSASAVKNTPTHTAATTNTGHDAVYTSFHVATKARRMPRQRVARYRNRMALAHTKGASTAKAAASSVVARSCSVYTASSYAA